MTRTQTTRTTIPTAIGVLSVVEALALFIGAVVHLGVQIPVGVMVLTEPRIIPATIVEGICGLALAGRGDSERPKRLWTSS